MVCDIRVTADRAKDWPRRLTPARVSELLGEPERLAQAKITDHITHAFRRFIAHSPFLAMASGDGAGHADCSPRGDYPGFVKVLDDRTLAVPDRLGNHLFDSFRNLGQCPAVGLLFLVPGKVETLRVNGSAYLTDEEDVLARLEAEGKRPKIAVIVNVAEAYVHCGRSILRSRLWEASSQNLAQHVPGISEMMREQVEPQGISVDTVQAEADQANRMLY